MTVKDQLLARLDLMLVNGGGVSSINCAADILEIVGNAAEHYIDQDADNIPSFIFECVKTLREKAKPFDEAKWSKSILDNSLKRFTGTTVRLEVDGGK